jgi:DnaK suppressor protein
MDEQTMSPQDAARWQARLDAREAELQEEVRTVGQEQTDTPSAVTLSQVDDMGEIAEELTRGAVRHAERQRDIEELRAIEAARERLADGSFGQCVDCGVSIPEARLEAQPAAARCITCQERFEATHPASPRVELPPRTG